MPFTSRSDTVSKPSVRIQRHPFDSAEARYLIPLLEADLAAFYPDWDELVHPGMHHENNPRPPAETVGGTDQDHKYNVEGEAVSMDTESRLQQDKSSGLLFFVAFAADSISIAQPLESQPSEVLIGCGALRLLPSPGQPLPAELDKNLRYAEVKRMYVNASYRGQGISKLILAELEKCALNVLDLDVMVLEVGLRQKAAVGLYRGAGYVERDMFGEYVGADPASGGESICLQKILK